MTIFPRFPPSLTLLISSCLNLLFGALGRPRRNGRPGRAQQGPAGFQFPFSLFLHNSERYRSEVRKGTKFWRERLIITLAGELGFRGTWFQLQPAAWRNHLSVQEHLSVEEPPLRAGTSLCAGTISPCKNHLWTGTTSLCRNHLSMQEPSLRGRTLSMGVSVPAQVDRMPNGRGPQMAPGARLPFVLTE